MTIEAEARSEARKKFRDDPDSDSMSLGEAFEEGFLEAVRWLAEHDREVAAKALREAHSDLQAYTDAGAPFGHRPVEDFLLSRADRIERGEQT